MRILIQSGALVCWNLGLVYGGGLGKIREKRFTLKSHPRQPSYQVAFGSTVPVTPYKSRVPATKKNFKKTVGKKEVVLLLDEELTKKCEAENDDGGFQEFICPSMEKLQQFITKNVDLFKSSANEIESIRKSLKDIDFVAHPTETEGEVVLHIEKIYRAPSPEQEGLAIFPEGRPKEKKEEEEEDLETKENTRSVENFISALSAVAESLSATELSNPEKRPTKEEIHRVMAGLALLALLDDKETACEAAKTSFSDLEKNLRNKCGIEKTNFMSHKTLCPGLVIALDSVASSCGQPVIKISKLFDANMMSEEEKLGLSTKLIEVVIAKSLHLHLEDSLDSLFSGI